MEFRRDFTSVESVAGPAACKLSGLRLRMAQGRIEMFCEHCNEAHPASDEVASGIPLSDQAEIDLEDLAALPGAKYLQF